VPRVVGARVVYRDGVPLAAHTGGRTEWLVDADRETRRKVHAALERGPSGRALLHEQGTAPLESSPH